METELYTEKITITRAYYTDQSKLMVRPITRVETKIFIDDTLYYADDISGELYHNTSSKVSDFLDWLFSTQPQNKGEKTVNEDLKELLTPIVQEVLNEEFKKIMTKIRSSAQ